MARTLREAFYQSPAYPPYFWAVRAAQGLRRRPVATVQQAAQALWQWPVVVAQRMRYRLSGGTDLPSGRLIKSVTGSTDVEWFLLSGGRGRASIEAILRKNGIALEHLGAVLDFGCGVGRVIRHWDGVRGPAFHGCDYNPQLIAWCQAHLRFASFKVNALVGELPYPDGTFGLVYALSVFTHLTEGQQDFWIGELSRILKPGGYLLISTQGEYYLPNIPADRRAEFERGERVVCGAEHAGTNTCTTFHPPAYVRNKLAPRLTVVDFIPEGALGNPRQDYCLLRKPPQG